MKRLARSAEEGSALLTKSAHRCWAIQAFRIFIGSLSGPLVGGSFSLTYGLRLLHLGKDGHLLCDHVKGLKGVVYVERDLGQEQLPESLIVQVALS